MRLAVVVLVAVLAAGCSREVGVTVELVYSSEECFGCEASGATLPSGTAFAFEVVDDDTEEALVSRCFSSEQAFTIAQLPGVLRGSELNDLEVPQGPTLFARFGAYSAACGDLTGASPFLESTSENLILGADSQNPNVFRLLLSCHQDLCAL